MFTSASRLSSVAKARPPSLKCLIHMDEGEGSTTWTDVLGHVVTSFGSVIQKSAAAKFGASGTQFSGSTDMISVDGYSDLAFGTGSFGISCWVNRTATGGAYQAVASTRIGADQDNRIYWEMGIQSNGGVYFYSAGFLISSTLVTVPVGTWTHLEVDRSNGVTTFYVNGQVAGSFTDTGNYTNGTITLGAFNAGSSDNLTAYMDEFAVSIGAPLHSSTFLPPNAPYNANPTTDPYYSSVVALLHLDSENGDLTFPDQKGNVFTAESSTAVVIVDDPQASGGKAAQFDGSSGGAIDGPTNYEPYRLHGDFTMEAFVTPSQFIAVAPIISMGTTFGNSGMILYLNASGQLVASSGNTQYIVSTQTLTVGARTHVALTRKSGLMTLWVGGQSGGTVTSAIDITDGLMSIGGSSPTAYRYKGKIDEVRVTNGVSRYNGPFTPPSAPFPNNS